MKWFFRTPTAGGGSGDMVLADVQTVTGAKTFEDGTLLLENVAGTFNASFTSTITADRVFTLPDSAGTIALTGAAPTAHAASHTDGSDDIQDATAAQKGLATATQITKLDGIEALADVTDATNVTTALGSISVSAHSDVVSATNTNRFVLVANGTTGYVGRALVEADISDLQTYALQSITLTAGDGLSGGGDLSTNRTFTVDLNELGTETAIALGDFIPMVDITDSGSQKITANNLFKIIDLFTQQGTPGSGDKFPMYDAGLSDVRYVDFDDMPGAAGGISNVVEDTTPQLGGDLDANTFDIQFDDATGIRDDSDNEHLIFQKTTTAVNFFEMTNSATGNAPRLSANGSDTDVDFEVHAKGTGDFAILDPADLTSVMKIDPSAIATGTTRTLTMPNQDISLAPGTDFQTQDTTLDSFAAYNTAGLITQTAADTFTGRTITGTASEITVTNGNGVSGNPTISLPSVIAPGVIHAWVPAAAMRPTVSNGCAVLTDVETTAGRPDMTVLDFDTTADEHAQFNIVFGTRYNLGTVTFKIYWTQSVGAVTTGVAFGLQGLATSDNESLDTAYGTAVVVTDDAQGAVEEVYISAESTAVTLGGTPADADYCSFRIFRDVSDANDDLAGDARLLGVMVIFTADQHNDA